MSNQYISYDVTKTLSKLLIQFLEGNPELDSFYGNKSKIEDFGIEEESLWWYLETRKFGTCVHSGFGLGFERLVSFVTGMQNIRDVIPFPRTPKSAEF